MNQRSGILGGGNWIRDHVKLVDAWPDQDKLVTIVGRSSGNGGSPYNILIDLAHLGATFPLRGVGLVGQDDDGRAILEDCIRHGIDVSGVRQTPEASTSYTDVVTVRSTGRRTFFHHRGANALLGPGDFDFSRAREKIFHLGYLLLLDRLDGFVDGKPAACEVFARASSTGLITSLDCVSEQGQRFPQVVSPVLPFVDILFANDFEAENLTGIRLRRDGKLSAEAVESVGRKIVAAGVRSWVVIHFPEGVFACDVGGRRLWQSSLRVPASSIVGSAGAGDALAAAVLYGVHADWPMDECLRLGVCTAAASLADASCSDGVKSVTENLQLLHAYGCGSTLGEAASHVTPSRSAPA